MKPPDFLYYDPQSVAEAVGLLASLENARLLAGGQSLMALLNMRYAFPDHLIDLNRIDALAGITREGDEIRIGAMTRQRDIEDSALVRDGLPLLIEALSHVGHRQTRNRGTIGGSLCHLDPAAEQVAVANNLDAVVEIAGIRGERRMPVAEFTVGFMTTALEPDEMVTAVRFPILPKGHGFSFMELARRHGDFAIVSVAATLVYDGAGKVERAAVTLSGVDAVPLRMVEAEAMLAGRVPDEALVHQAARTAAGIEALEDAMVPSWYRRQVAETMMRRALVAADARANKGH
ncbi:MAG TPA: xanthine dehydrogenase family protein subunit M [Stellaceae bacterium]|nr:xanthine dehydrogenase family protein subunit M [Stellaceae bacterium]